MVWRPAHHKYLAQAADAVTILVSFLVAYYCRQLMEWLEPSLPLGLKVSVEAPFVALMVAIATVWVILFDLQGAYSYQRFTSFATELKLVLRTVIIGCLLIVGALFLLRLGYVPRTLLLLFGLLSFLLLSLEKLLVFQIASKIRECGYNRKAVLVVGTGRQTQEFMKAIERNFSWGLDIIGFLDAGREGIGQIIFGRPILGSFSDIVSVMHAHRLDEVIITVSTSRLPEIKKVLEACEREGVQIRIISDFLGKIAKGVWADTIYNLPIISINYVSDNRNALMIKRVIDIIGSLILLILLAPVFLIVAFALKIFSPGPLFYELEVMGFNRKPFKIRKFRTMVVDADKMKQNLFDLNEMEGPVFKMHNDPRVTPFGRFLRKYSLDELPQLWNVLNGDLSLVGPRAPGPHELVNFESWHRRKLSIKPGLTCLWQVNGRNNVRKFDDWVKMDLEYIDNWSLWLDLKILLKTIPVVIRGTGL
jgi:exopolysaccharide biosynthesis polyprenyl glycosylphosphotransferase